MIGKGNLYTVDIQNWLATTLLKAGLADGLKKFSIIMPKDLLAELSTEQAVGEAEKIPVEINYFQNEIAAMNWFFE